MHMSSYLLPFLDTGIDDICIYLSTLTDIPYLDDEKLSMKTFFLVVIYTITYTYSYIKAPVGTTQVHCTDVPIGTTGLILYYMTYIYSSLP